MSNVYALVAAKTGYTNVDVKGDAIPLTNISGPIPGALNAEFYVPFTAPNISAVGAGGGKVFVASNLDTNLTVASAPSPVNLTAMSMTVPAEVPTATAPGATQSGGTGGSGSSAAVGIYAGKAMLLSVVGAALGAAAVLL